MQFLMMYTPDKQEHAGPEDMARMEKLVEEGKKAGTLIATGGLAPGSMTMKVRRAGSKITVTDGPFPETKELIIGFALVEATSRDDAIEQARTFLRLAGDGESHIIPVLSGAPPKD